MNRSYIFQPNLSSPWQTLSYWRSGVYGAGFVRKQKRHRAISLTLARRLFFGENNADVISIISSFFGGGCEPATSCVCVFASFSCVS
jgi:hypothetical protein